MPYIIETKTPRGPVGDISTMTAADAQRALDWQREADTSRVAVATLDEARKQATNEARDRLPDTGFRRWMHTVDAAQELPAEGGTVGPLPDGTVIEVRHVGWWELGEKSGLPGYPALDAHRKILDAYNNAR